MKTRRIFTLFFSVFALLVFAQETDSVRAKWKYEPNFTVGVDVLNAAFATFSDRKLFKGFVSSRISRKIHGVAELGVEKNSYNKNGYDATASGFFIKPGAFYMLSVDPENTLSGFYGGAKLGASFYSQEYYKIPVRGYEGSDQSVAFPKSSQSSYWVEANAGGRVKVFDTNFFIDLNVQPKFLVYTTKQEGIMPMIIPGFGKSSSKFAMGFSWNIGYLF